MTDTDATPTTSGSKASRIAATVFNICLALAFGLPLLAVGAAAAVRIFCYIAGVCW